ncbi:MAG TPA: imelysin family protein [Polyangiales bacterium]
MRRIAPALLMLPFLACGDDANEDAFPTSVATQAITNYKQLVTSNYADVVASANALKTAVAAFVAAPSDATQKAAQDAWRAARVPYGPSEAFRFYEGPIDDPDDGPEGQINAWPLDENYIDYTRDDPSAGIVNTPTDDLSIPALARDNTAKGEKAISTGYHAIEFLLWGQDDPTPGTGAGKRSYTDYVVGGSALNPQRRGQYLLNVTDLLVQDLTKVSEQWKPGADNFAAQFGQKASEAGVDPIKQAISDMLKSIGSMAKAELSGERMTVAFKSKDQEDEHSCFSDNTSVDLLGNGLGIQNVWLGRYGSLDGVGVQDVVAAVDDALAQKTTADLAQAVAQLQLLADLQQKSNTPFDQVIASPDDSPGRVAVLAAIKALKDVAADVETAAKALGLEIQLEDPSQSL